MKRLIIIKILFIVLLVFYITGCDDEISVPEGTLKVVLKNAPDYNLYNLKILIYSLEDKINAIEERIVPNNQEIEIDLNIGNYLVKLSSYPSYNNLYLYEKAFQIRQDNITEIIFEINE